MKNILAKSFLIMQICKRKYKIQDANLNIVIINTRLCREY